MAVLYRTNFQSRQIEEALRRYGRKYNVVGGFSFYQRAEIKDMVAYLKLAASQRRFGQPAAHHQHARRAASAAPPWSRSRSYAREHGLSLWDAIERMIDDAAALHALAIGAGDVPQPDPGDSRWWRSRVAAARPAQVHPGPHRLSADAASRRRRRKSETRLENLNELMNAAAEAAERGESVADFLDHAALVADADALDEQAPVTLMTMHNAKGLEFPVVFISRHGRRPLPAQPLDEFRGGAWKRSGGSATSA